jgi:chorismate mutase
MGLLVLLAVAGVVYWQNQNAARRQAAEQARKEAGPPVLQSVETRLIPAFDSLTRTQIAQELRQLPATERTRDTVATRKYRRLAERYWKAENQSTYLLEQLRQTKPDATLPGQASTVLEEWHRLNKALAYDHKLTPVLTERMELMRRAAYLRMDLLQNLSGRYQNGLPIYTPALTRLQDSASVMREALLSREKWTARLRRGTL